MLPPSADVVVAPPPPDVLAFVVVLLLHKPTCFSINVKRLGILLTVVVDLLASESNVISSVTLVAAQSFL